MADGGLAAAGFALAEYRLRLAGREWRVLHTGEVLSFLDEQRLLSEPKDERPPYGVLLWPAAVALAHELAGRAAGDGAAFGGCRMLELGAGTGLPGIVAASFGARVVQTDRHEAALAVCRENGRRNGVAASLEYRLADWTAWDDAGRYDWILGADVLYGETLHPHLRRIFDENLAPGGRLLVADPFRAASLRLLEAMAADGWRVAGTKWSITKEDDDPDEGAPRPIGVFELTRPS